VRRMLAAAPYSWDAFSAAAIVASDLGACREALSLQRRALELLPERSPPRWRAEFSAALAGYSGSALRTHDAPTPRPWKGRASRPATSPVTLV